MEAFGRMVFLRNGSVIWTPRPRHQYDETNGSGVKLETLNRQDLTRELERHHEAGFGWALHCCRGDAEEARDVLHAAYLKILEGTTRFEGRSEFRTWLFSIVRNTAGERRRRWARRLKLLERRWSLGLLSGDSDTNSTPRADERLYRSELRQTVHALLGGLSRRQRDLLHLVFYQDLTLAEAAGVLEISVGAARVHYHRGKRRLRKGILESGVHDEGIWREGNQTAL